MQRSRKALLTRRASGKTNGKNLLYMVSLSLVVFLWGLLFLLDSWIGRGDGYKDGLGDLPRGVKKGGKFKLEPQNLIKDSYIYQAASKEENVSNESPVNERKPNQFSFTIEEPKEMPDSKTERSRPRYVPLDLDEFKNRAFSTKSRPSNGNVGSIIHRLEPGGTDYNYASASKGAKVLAHNKEAKGASNVLSGDKDKYLRNPCSSDEKFVVLELSEETLVDTIEIANFEHHSSNLKGFELFGSLVYPAESWVKLGNFTAGNVKHMQRFVLHKPKWVRYIKLNLRSHYGTDFYCTLSVVGVYGVDAVETMLEDLVYAQNNKFSSEQHESDPKPEDFSVEPQPEPQPEPQQWLEEPDANRVAAATDVPDPLVEIRQQQIGRSPGDSVLKILMQKVRLLEVNMSLLERFLNELSSRYGCIFKEIDSEIGETDIIVDKIRTDLMSLHESKEVVTKHVDDLVSWKLLVSIQLDNMVRDNAFLRSEVAKVRENQVHMENKGVVLFLVSLTFGLLAIASLFLDKVLFVYYSKDRSEESTVKFWQMDYSSVFLVLSCSIIMIISSL